MPCTGKSNVNKSDFMRNQQNQNQRRNRGRNNNNRGGQPNFRSGGMNDARARGNAQQLLEKYKNMARDAASSGDRVLAEYYMQHADHYYRVVTEFRARFEENRPRDQRSPDEQYEDGDDNGGDEVEGVDSVDLHRPQNFAATVAGQNVGADSAPTNLTQPVAMDNGGDNAQGDEAGSDESGEESAERQRRRGRSRRGPSRRPAEAATSEPVES